MSNFMEYASKTQSNIVPKENFENLTLDVFNTLSDNLSKSFGPLGSNTTILDGMMTDATKDGFTIFKNYRFTNRYKTMIYNLMKAPCTTLNNTVGDGTTTAIVMTNNLFKEYKRYENIFNKLHRLPRQFTRAWDEVINSIIDKIGSYATPLELNDHETVRNIAYVVSNGNTEISKNFADIYASSASPMIKSKNSPTNKSYVEEIVGFEFPVNLISEAYAQTEDLSVVVQDACVLLFNYKINTEVCNDFIIPINEILQTMNKKLLVIAPQYDRLTIDNVLSRYHNIEVQKSGNPNLLLGQYQQGKLAENQLEDLSIVLRTVIIDQENIVEYTNLVKSSSEYGILDEYDIVSKALGDDASSPYYRMLGRVDRSILSCITGALFQVDDIEKDDRYKDILKSAEVRLQGVIDGEDLERQSYSFKVSQARARVSQLKMQNHIYYIGADSTLQHRILEDSVEDVIKCLRSASKSGIVPGCQLSVIKACDELTMEYYNRYDSETDKDENGNIMVSDTDGLLITITDMIKNAVVGTYSRILHGPNNTGIAKTLKEYFLYDWSNEEAVKEISEKASKKCSDIIKESIETNKVFDLETLEFSDKIITSAETDIMVLKASSELVKLLISGNQCVVVDSDLNGVHDEIVEI